MKEIYAYFCVAFLLLILLLLFPENEKLQKSPEKTDSKVENMQDETEPVMQKKRIRILITNSGKIYHDKITLKTDTQILELSSAGTEFAKTDILHITKDCADGEKVDLDIYKEKEGLVMVEELSLEDYLMGVVPSEMPASYPLQALYAQAVCARTYAYRHMNAYSYPKWAANMDDTVSFQVYNTAPPNEKIKEAVDCTRDMILMDENENPMEIYYFSTSCGKMATKEIWHEKEEREFEAVSPELAEEKNREFDEYISKIYESHPEHEEPFYRWTCKSDSFDTEKIMVRCQERKIQTPFFVCTSNGCKIEEAGKIKDLYIGDRLECGIADILILQCEKADIYILGEYSIRYVLASNVSHVEKQDNTYYSVENLLPSAFISLKSNCNKEGDVIGYEIIGGGFGHGVGMSQNGARALAKQGYTYKDILKTYYPNGKIGKVYEE